MRFKHADTLRRRWQCRVVTSNEISFAFRFAGALRIFRLPAAASRA